MKAFLIGLLIGGADIEPEETWRCLCCLKKVLKDIRADFCDECEALGKCGLDGGSDYGSGEK